MKRFRTIAVFVLAMCLLNGCTEQAAPSSMLLSDEGSAEVSIRDTMDHSAITPTTPALSTSQTPAATAAAVVSTAPSGTDSKVTPPEPSPEEAAGIAAEEQGTDATLSPAEEPAGHATAPIALEISSDALRTKIYSAQNADNVSDEVKEAFLAWFEEESQVSTKNLFATDEWIWEYCISTREEVPVILLECHHPEDGDYACFIYDGLDGSVS